MKILILFLFSILSFQVSSQSGFSGNNYGLDAIYGLDDRIEIHDEQSPEITALKESIGLIFAKDLFVKGLFNSQIKTQSLKENARLCAGEKFASNKSVNGCTGFLVGEDLMVSAGHCFMTPDDCTDKLIVFGLGISQQTESGYSVRNRDVYECAEILDTQFNGQSDFSLIRINKKTKRVALKIRQKGMIKSTDEVFMLGHPMGSPLKKSNQVKVSDNDNQTFFKAPLDSFTGNSGSPVFNARTLLVEGILVNGQEDFLLDDSKQCYRNRIYEEDNSSMSGEGVTRISEILGALTN